MLFNAYAEEANKSLIKDYNKQSYSSISGTSKILDASAMYEQYEDEIKLYQEMANGWLANWDELAEDEKNRIIATDTSNKRFSDPIMDNVFCLTYDEMTEYKVSAKAQITEYLSNSDSIISLNTGDYWLRSLALDPSGNAYVSGGQGVVYDVVSSWKIGVRPAMWIEW